MEGFLAGFSLAPKPLKGVELKVIEGSILSHLPTKDVLQALTTSNGLSSWLGSSSDFLCHVGIKFSVNINGEDSKAVFTTVDLPRRLAFMVEALGEFEFQIISTARDTKVNFKVRRALNPEAEPAWLDQVGQRIAAFEGVMNVG